MTLFRPLPPGLSFSQPGVVLATWFGVGLIRKASGTFGSLAALPFAYALMALGGWPWLLAGIIIVTLTGFWAAAVVARSGEVDSSVTVIDEVAGQWIALLPAALDPVAWVIAFVAFRGFDTLKPWPIGWIDRATTSAIGVMVDDLVAGVFAALVVIGAGHFLLA